MIHSDQPTGMRKKYDSVIAMRWENILARSSCQWHTTRQRVYVANVWLVLLLKQLERILHIGGSKVDVQKLTAHANLANQVFDESGLYLIREFDEHAPHLAHLRITTNFELPFNKSPNLPCVRHLHKPMNRQDTPLAAGSQSTRLCWHCD